MESSCATFHSQRWVTCIFVCMCTFINVACSYLDLTKLNIFAFTSSIEEPSIYLLWFLISSILSLLGTIKLNRFEIVVYVS